VVNDGPFGGSRAALLTLDATLRSWLPQSRQWRRLGGHAQNCRNQFLFNLALAHLNCGVPLDEKFNMQVQAREVELAEVDGCIKPMYKGRPVHILHFCGAGRGLRPIMRDRLFPGSGSR
jgi:hypothetical protein